MASGFHSLTGVLANKRRTLVKSPVNNSYHVTSEECATACALAYCLFGRLRQGTLVGQMRFPLLAIVFCVSLSMYGQQKGEPATTKRFHYVLLNDTGGGTLWPKGMGQQVTAEIQFLRQVVSTDSDVGSLVNFDQDSYLDVKDSSNPDDIIYKIDRQSHHFTAIYDAVVAAALWLDKQESSDRKNSFLVF
jgi:hypothetical protein